MAQQKASGAGTPAESSDANVALGLARVALALYVVAMIVAEDDNGWLWLLAGLVGGAAAIKGWMAGRPKPRGRALAAVVIGGLLCLAIIGWIIVAAITGDL